MDYKTEQQIARDLEACDLGIALTTGKVKAKYVKHRKDCIKAIHESNERDGLNTMTDAELLAALTE